MGNSSTPAQNKQHTPTSGKGFGIARVNQVSVEVTADGADITIGMFYINSIPAVILFDSKALRSFFLLDMPPPMNYHFKICKGTSSNYP
jgi:hypothetical protein